MKPSSLFLYGLISFTWSKAELGGWDFALANLAALVVVLFYMGLNAYSSRRAAIRRRGRGR